MKNKCFETLLEGINNQLSILAKNGYKIYDAENPDYFISEIEYCKEDDQLEFKCMEDTEGGKE